MSKAFTKETDNEPDDTDEPDPLPRQSKNYVTPRGLALLQAEYKQLLHDERPKMVEVVSWAAGNGDRSENGDYIYGKKRLREIDRRLRYLTKRLDSAELVDPERQKGLDKVFFGATVTYVREDDSEHTVTLVGIDEADATHGNISWTAPVARALMKKQVGDTAELYLPDGAETIEVLGITYETADEREARQRRATVSKVK